MQTQIGIGAWSAFFWNFIIAYFVFIPLFPSSAGPNIAPLIYWQITAIIGHTATMWLWLIFWKWKRHGKGGSVKIFFWTYASVLVVTAGSSIIGQAIHDRNFSNVLGITLAAVAGITWVFLYLAIPLVIDALAAYKNNRG